MLYTCFLYRSIYGVISVTNLSSAICDGKDIMCCAASPHEVCSYRCRITHSLYTSILHVFNLAFYTLSSSLKFYIVGNGTIPHPTIFKYFILIWFYGRNYGFTIARTLAIDHGPKIMYIHYKMKMRRLSLSTGIAGDCLLCRRWNACWPPHMPNWRQTSCEWNGSRCVEVWKMEGNIFKISCCHIHCFLLLETGGTLSSFLRVFTKLLVFFLPSCDRSGVSWMASWSELW